MCSKLLQQTYGDKSWSRRATMTVSELAVGITAPCVYLQRYTWSAYFFVTFFSCSYLYANFLCTLEYKLDIE